MAIVDAFEPTTKNRIGRPSHVTCGFAQVEINGSPYLVLETYGSTGRQFPGKASQSLHLDRNAAASLKALLERSFPGI